MVRSNSKVAISNIRAYIMKHYDFSGYEINVDVSDYHEVAVAIFETFLNEYKHNFRLFRSQQDAFEGWCQGLPSVISTMYYYNEFARPYIAFILDETQEESERYTEEEACHLLTYLLYRELSKEWCNRR